MFAFTKLQKAKAIIKKQFETAALLEQEYSKQYSTPELTELNQAQILTSLNQLHLVNQAIRKEYQLVSPSYKLKGAPGIVYEKDAIGYESLKPYKLDFYYPTHPKYIRNAISDFLFKQLAKKNKKLSDILGIEIDPGDIYTFEFHLMLKSSSLDTYFIESRKLTLPTLEALATYHKCDIVTFALKDNPKPQGELWKIMLKNQWYG